MAMTSEQKIRAKALKSAILYTRKASYSPSEIKEAADMFANYIAGYNLGRVNLVTSKCPLCEQSYGGNNA